MTTQRAATASGRFFALSTEQVRSPWRREFWRDTALNRSEADFHAAGRSAPFSATISGYLGAHCQIRDGRSDPIILRRTAETCRRDGSDEILISAIVALGQTSGAFILNNQEVEAREGDLVVLDLARPLTADTPRYREVNFRLSRGLVAAATGIDPGRFGGRVLPRTPLTTMLFAHLRGFADSLPSMNEPDREAMLNTTAEFALQTLRVVADRLPVESDARSGWLWQAVCRMIDRNLGRRDLSPERIANELRCSRSRIYRLFASRGLSVMEHVAGQRLNRAHAMLGDPDNHLTIGDVAMACGFDDPSSFSRLFRRRFGCQPREVREQGRAGAEGEGLEA